MTQNLNRHTKRYKQLEFYYLSLFSYMCFGGFFTDPSCSVTAINTTQTTFMGFPEQRNFGDKFETTVTENADSHTQNTKTWPFYLQQHVLSAPCIHAYQLD